MPMKITLGWLKKIGQPEYGSLGANCSVEFEADQALFQKEPNDFFKHMEHAFGRPRHRRLQNGVEEHRAERQMTSLSS